MKKLVLITLIISVFTVFAEDPKKENTFEVTESVTKSDFVVINGKRIDYDVNAGYITLKTEYGEEKAHIFFVAYTKKNVPSITERPLTFSFNGGPGSSSVWMHLGMLGPKRVKMTDEGYHEKPPYSLIDNEYSWLDQTDLVFIDPISTGFSRSEKEKEAKQYHGLDGDIESVGAFIQRYLAQNKRWGSPKYLIGESYGTLRAAKLSKHLIDRYGMFLNGISLVSFVNDFSTISFGNGNDLPYSLFLPTYTSTAYYHKKLAPELQNKPLEEVLDEVEAFALNEYTSALMKGYTLSDSTKNIIADKLSFYTGLSKEYVLKTNLRINIHYFRKEILRDAQKAVGRFDARYTAEDVNQLRLSPETDPSFSPAVQGAYSTMINDYLTRELGFTPDLSYEVLTGKVWPWDYSSFENKYVNVSYDLRKALITNPDMKVWIANGYYDLATPYFATEYTINHIMLPEAQKKNIKMTYHQAGHMMYLHKPSLIEMKKEAELFYIK